ncbi:MAG TPA: hypothetical protein VIM28_08505 [Solirubrobacterales bacterium]
MKRTLGTFAAIAIAMLAIAPLAIGEEQTRDSYKAQVEPICQANRSANEKIMAGAKERVNKGKLVLAGKQFIQVSGSVGGLIKQLATIPAPTADERRIEHWLGSIQLLKQRLREVGKYYKAGEKIKATHESILAERAGLSANNTSILFHFHYCRFSHIGG